MGILPSSLCPLSHSHSSLRPVHSCVQVLLTLLHSPPHPSPAASHWLVSDQQLSLTIQKAQLPNAVTWVGSEAQATTPPPHLLALPVQSAGLPALTSAWMMFQAFFRPTLFSVLYSSRPSFRSFLAFSFTCPVEADRQDSWDQDAACPGQLELLASSLPGGGVPGQGRSTLPASVYTHGLRGKTSHTQATLPAAHILPHAGPVRDTLGTRVADQSF